jgi:hypothetical protein
MGTASGRSGSHPVILSAVADRSVQATVIVVGLLSWSDPFPFFPVFFRGCPCGSPWRLTLFQKPALHRRKTIADYASSLRGRECWYLADPTFAFLLLMRTFYRSLERQIYFN